MTVRMCQFRGWQSMLFVSLGILPRPIAMWGGCGINARDAEIGMMPQLRRNGHTWG